MTNEAKIDGAQVWYLGNNRKKDLQIVQPSWNNPFFLTTDFTYAEEYSDYGVWKVLLNDAMKSSILDFSKPTETKKLNWPKVLIDQIKTGKSDLNAIGFDMYCMANRKGELYQIKKTAEWEAASKQFAEKAAKPINGVPYSHWQDDSDNAFVLAMWRDIAEAGFKGFTHTEYGHQILALFTIDAIDKISAKRVSHA